MRDRLHPRAALKRMNFAPLRPRGTVAARLCQPRGDHCRRRRDVHAPVLPPRGRSSVNQNIQELTRGRQLRLDRGSSASLAFAAATKSLDKQRVALIAWITSLPLAKSPSPSRFDRSCVCFLCSVPKKKVWHDRLRLKSTTSSHSTVVSCRPYDDAIRCPTPLTLSNPRFRSRSLARSSRSFLFVG